MRIFFITLILFPLSIFASNPIINIQHWDLSNHTRVFFVKRTELPMLDVQLIFSAGSSRDGDLPGLAVLTNSMIGEGAFGLSAKQIANNFENVGAQFRVSADRDMAYATLRTTINSDHLNSVLENFATVIQKPTFPEGELNRIKQQLLAQLKSQKQDPSQIANNLFYQSIYQHNFYAHNPLGDADSVDVITQKQLINFYKKFYVGANANLILVGDISESQAKTISEKIAGQLPEGNTAPDLSAAENIEKSRMENSAFPSTQSTLIIGGVGITRQNPDYYALMLGNAVLGGLPMSSILYDEIREKRGLVYTITSAFDPLQYRGPFMIYLQTKSSTVVEADDLVKKILRKFVDEGPTTAQLNAAKRSMINGFPLSLSSNRAILTVVSNIAFYHRPLDYVDQYEKNMNAVTTEQVKQAFQKNIDLNKLVTVVVGVEKNQE